MKLETLTSEQEKVLTEVKNEYLSLAFSGKEIDRDEATKGIKWLYKFSNLKEPIIIFLDSPMSVQVGTEYAIRLLGKKKEVWSQVRSQVENQVWSQVRSQVWNQVENQVGSQVGSQVRSQVRNQVRSQVENQVWSQVRSQVRSQVENQVWSQVRSQVWKTKIEYRSFSSYANIWDYGWLSFYTVFERLDIELGESLKDFKKFRDLMKSGIFNMIQLDRLCVVSALPVSVKRNSNNAIHSLTSPAVSFRDGYNQHYLNGVFFPETLWKKAVNKEISFKEINAIQDIDQRTQAMAFLKPEDFKNNGKIVDTFTKYDINGKEVKYELLKVPQGIFRIEAYFALYNCPSTDKFYMSGIDPEVGKKGIVESMAWKFLMSADEFKRLIPLKNES